MSMTSRRPALRLLFPLAIAAMVAAPAVARADDAKDCPPGSWFCGETKPPEKGSDPPELPPAQPEKAAPATQPAPPPPPVVVYQPPPPAVIVQPREAPPAYYYVPRTPRPKKEWGLNLHLGGAMMGKGRDGDAGMALLGLGLRYRPLPAAAIEANLDFAGGRDYNGYRRSETAITFNGLIYLNPKSKTQVYLLGGFGWSGAKAVDDRGDDQTYRYGYFGAQAGAGLEFRLSKVVALNIDMRGFVRGRVDDSRRTNPEFTDGTGRSSNTSGGGLLQGGITFYW